jgi:hypothetical protein
MPKKHHQFIQSSVQDLLHLLEENPEIKSVIGRFRLTAVLGFLIEMTEVYPIDEDHKKRLVEVRDGMAHMPAPQVFTDLN